MAKKQQMAAQAQKSALEPIRVKCLRRDISHFLVYNSELLDSKVKFHLVQGFNRVLKKAKKQQIQLKINILVEKKLSLRGAIFFAPRLKFLISY